MHAKITSAIAKNCNSVTKVLTYIHTNDSEKGNARGKACFLLEKMERLVCVNVRNLKSSFRSVSQNQQGPTGSIDWP